MATEPKETSVGPAIEEPKDGSLNSNKAAEPATGVHHPNEKVLPKIESKPKSIHN